MPNSPRPKVRAACLLEPEARAAVFGTRGIDELRAVVDLIDAPHDPAQVVANPACLEDAEVLFTGWGVPSLDERLLAAWPRLRAVFHAAGSVKSFATDALWDRGIRVSCAAKANAIPVAEFTVSQIVFCLKQGWQRWREVQDRRADFRKEDPHTPGVYESTVALLSLGHIGRLVADRLRHFDVYVIAYDPLVAPEDFARLGIEPVTLEEAFARADVVSCHLPLLPQTRGLLGTRHFAALRPGASFINTARGGVVRQSELVDVLRERSDLVAVLDVTDPEPPPPDCALRSLPNVVITPHIAGSIGRECRRLSRMMVEDFGRYQRGEPLVGEVFSAQLSRLA